MNLKKKLFKYWIKCYCYNNRYILKIKRHIKNDVISNSILLITSPYIMIRWGVCVMIEKLYATRHIRELIEAEKNICFKHELAMVSISKNEGPYIKEWIEYHLMVGFTKFYFYDNESNDNTKDVLQPYIDQNIVEYIYYPGKAQQLNAYNDAIKKHKKECRYIAFMDMDEFIMPTIPFKPIYQIISEQIEKSKGGAAGIGVNWAIFGTSGHTKKPEGLVTKNFIKRGINGHWANYLIKTICNPRMIDYYISPHYPIYKLGAYSINDSDGSRLWGWFCHEVKYETLRINHYFTKSEEEYKKKHARGLADRNQLYNFHEMFIQYNLNDIEDYSMYQYIKLLYPTTD